MTPGTVLFFVPMLIGMFAMQPATVERGVTRMVSQDEVVLRVPIQPRPLARNVRWVERKGPRCIRAGAIRRAMLSGPEQVDFLLAGRGRVRAEFAADCPALDFYGGFYLRPEGDSVCAGRDAVHSRIGGSCTIARFKHLVPQIVEARR